MRGRLLGFELLVLSLCVMASADEKVLYEKRSAYNDIIVTEDQEGLRTLWFDNGDARQSVVKVGDPDYLALPYARAMVAALSVVEQPRRVLIVGLGGGTIPSFLHKHFPRMQIDVVEIDAEVVAVAKRFFGFREDATMRVYVNDGRKLIEQSRGLYDIIFLDAFGAESIPYSLTTNEFLQAVRRALTAKGIAVGNVWSRESNPLYDAMVRTYQEAFEELYILDVRAAGNQIFLAVPRVLRMGREDLAQRASKVSRENRFPFDMGELVRYGYRFEGVKDPQARVLRGQDRPPPKAQNPRPPVLQARP